MNTIQKYMRAIMLIVFLAILIISPDSMLSLLSLPVIGMALAKDRTKINVKGGGLLKIRETTAAGAETTMLDVGYLSNVVVAQDGKMVEIPNDSGMLIQMLSGGLSFTIEGTLLQVGKDEMDVLLTASDKFFYAYYQALMSNTKYQEIYIGLCKIEANMEKNYAAGSPQTLRIRIHALLGKHTGTVTLAPTAANHAVGVVAVLAENAAAQGEITTVASTIYSSFV